MSSPQARPNGLDAGDDLVAHGVIELLVDATEVIEVDEDEGEFDRSLGGREVLPEALPERLGRRSPVRSSWEA